MSPSVFDLISVHDFTAGLPEHWTRRLSWAGRPVYRASGRRLCREGSPADRFWLVHGGAVAIDFFVPGRGDVVIERLGPGSVVGWSWLLPPGRSRTPADSTRRARFGAVAADDLRAVEMDAARVHKLMAEDPDLGLELHRRFLGVTAARLAAARHRLAELYAIA
ncbi:cyclic nucleotide-binding domain-containing protein [Paractinoplanes deccanensis]